MTATRVRDLLAIAAVATVLSWLVVRQWYGELPQLEWFVPLSLALLGFAEAVVGFQLRARIRREPGLEPVHPLVAARTVALAKASSLVGAAMTGVWGGFLIHTSQQVGYLAAADEDAFVAGVGVVSALGLTGGALWLEYCLRTPKPPEDEDDERRPS